MNLRRLAAAVRLHAAAAVFLTTAVIPDIARDVVRHALGLPALEWPTDHQLLSTHPANRTTGRNPS